MLTIGVDLAAEPKGTAVSVSEWSHSTATVSDLVIGAGDADIVAASRAATKIGIDCALGWPESFVEFVVNHRDSAHHIHDEFGAMDWRRELVYRETDRRVRAETGRWPLSVATDRLGVTALRCAGLVARLGEAGVDIDRSGWGGIVEVYPAGTLARWNVNSAGYRASADVRRRMLSDIAARAPWFHVDAFAEPLVESCDAFDSVVAALSARAAAIGAATLPSDDDIAIAQIEGWIALPSVGIEGLVQGA